MKTPFLLFKVFFLLNLCLLSCISQDKDRPLLKDEVNDRRTPDEGFVVEIQGHRGCRGLYPENTIEGFKAAVDLGIDVLELDVVISKDSMVVVSHEPWMNPDLFTDENGETLGLLPICVIKYNLFNMNYHEIRGFKCGTLTDERFPHQMLVESNKPLLKEVLSTIQSYCLQKDVPLPKFNIELKYLNATSGIHHPNADQFAKLVLGVTKESGLDQHCSFQAFDPVQLEALFKVHPKSLVYLIANDLTLNENLEKLSFRPEVYSPNHELLDQGMVDEIHGLEMRCIPWTVNSQNEMEKLIGYGVDGIITDYPDSLLELRFMAL